MFWRKVSSETLFVCIAGGGEEWKDVAERLGLSATEIRFLDAREKNPCDAALSFVSQRCCMNVDDLYNVLVECGMPVPADIL